jgi:deoxycytidylate deaminase
MNLTFTGDYKRLQELLLRLGGEWDETQPNKKVYRRTNGILNWFETTGTISFQGKEPEKSRLERDVRAILSPESIGESGITDPITTPASYPTVAAEEAPVIDVSTSERFLLGQPIDSELVIGIVSSVGTESNRVLTSLKDRLLGFGYDSVEIKVSSLMSSAGQQICSDEYQRIRYLMNTGDELRRKTNNNGILALGASKKISEARATDEGKKTAYIVNSLKHPEEVLVLRKIYQQGFYLLGIHADVKRRLAHLIEDKCIEQSKATELTLIDEDEKIKHGQKTRDTFHLADLFLSLGSNDDQIKNSIQRFLELIFGNPHLHPTFDEYAMFMAFSSSARSGDLSRQVGAIIAKNRQIIASGANECPAANGGQYWAEPDSSGRVIDVQGGKDCANGADSNKVEQLEIISDIVTSCNAATLIPRDALSAIETILRSSRITDLTEFGRVVHAEMDALLSCARAGISCNQGVMYCTTFPCHNCAKHIVAAGLSKVVYVEPYPKSKALDLHPDSIVLQTDLDQEPSPGRVVLRPFTGVGARRFLDFFSMSLGAGGRLKRKDGDDGTKAEWTKEESRPRVTLVPSSYRDLEQSASSIFDRATRGPN